MGCSNEGLSGGKPPKAFIEIENGRFETTLGTYCWNGGGKGTCIDTAGPIELLEGKKPLNRPDNGARSIMMWAACTLFITESANVSGFAPISSIKISIPCV